MKAVRREPSGNDRKSPHPSPDGSRRSAKSRWHLAMGTDESQHRRPLLPTADFLPPAERTVPTPRPRKDATEITAASAQSPAETTQNGKSGRWKTSSYAVQFEAIQRLSPRQLWSTATPEKHASSTWNITTYIESSRQDSAPVCIFRQQALICCSCCPWHSARPPVRSPKGTSWNLFMRKTAACRNSVHR
ncbi:MAG: hypothetical protein RL215_1787 [Planctomycetota bacterium]